MNLDLTNGDMLDVSPIVERKSNIITPIASPKSISTNLQSKSIAQPISVAPTITPTTSTGGIVTGGFIPRINPIRLAVKRGETSQEGTGTIGGISIPRTIPTSTTNLSSASTSSSASTTNLSSASTSSSATPTSSPKSTPSTTTGGGAVGSAEISDEGSKTDEGEKKAGEKIDVDIKPTLPKPDMATTTTGSGTTDTTTTTTTTPTTTTPTTKQDTKKGMLWIIGLIAGGIGGYFLAKSKNKSVLTYALIGAGVGGGVGLLADKYMGKGSGLKKGKSGSPNDSPTTTMASGSTDSLDEFVNKMIESMRLFMKALSGGIGAEQFDKEFNEQIEKQKPIISKGIKDAFAKLNDKEKPALLAWVDFQLSKLKNYNEATFEKESKEKKDELNKKFGVDVEEIYNRFSKEIQVK